MSTQTPSPLGLHIQTTFSATSFTATVTDYRMNALTFLSTMTPAQREAIVRDAWSIGMRAIVAAHRQSEEARFGEASTALIQQVDEKLKHHVERQHDLTQRLLKQYFDPNDGAVGQRMNAFVRDGGELSRALDKYLAVDQGALAQTLTRTFDVARSESPFGRFIGVLQKELTTALGSHAQGMTQTLTQMDERQQSVALTICETVSRLETQKRSDATSPKGGQEFEQSVATFAHAIAACAPLTIDATGHKVGKLSGCKVGDLVMTFTEESASPGAAIVIEAKRDQSYTVSQARKELDLARKNRGALVGLFVVAKSHSDGFAPFARYGSDVIVVWDPEDPASHPYLHASFLLALSMASRGTRKANQGGDALDDFQGRIEAEVKRFADMRQHAERIMKSADAIAQSLVTSEAKLKTLVDRAAKTALFLREAEVDAASHSDFEPTSLALTASNETDEGVA